MDDRAAILSQLAFKRYRPGQAERAVDILVGRFMLTPRRTRRALAEQYGISIERVRQIEAQALRILRRRFGLDRAAFYDAFPPGHPIRRAVLGEGKR